MGDTQLACRKMSNRTRFKPLGYRFTFNETDGIRIAKRRMDKMAAEVQETLPATMQIRQYLAEIGQAVNEDDIAEETGIPIGTVHGTLYRMLQSEQVVKMDSRKVVGMDGKPKSILWALRAQE